MPNCLCQPALYRTLKSKNTCRGRSRTWFWGHFVFHVPFWLAFWLPCGLMQVAKMLFAMRNYDKYRGSCPSPGSAYDYKIFCCWHTEKILWLAKWVNRHLCHSRITQWEQQSSLDTKRKFCIVSSLRDDVTFDIPGYLSFFRTQCSISLIFFPISWFPSSSYTTHYFFPRADQCSIYPEPAVGVRVRQTISSPKIFNLNH